MGVPAEVGQDPNPAGFAGWLRFSRTDHRKTERMIIAASTVAVVAIAVVIVVALIALIYIVPRGGRRRR
jgi:hypothetical protein